MLVIKSNEILLHGVAESVQGGRPENQDDLCFLDTPFGFLLVVCDGMGGGPGGKTASYIAKMEISQTLAECDSMMSREKALKMAVSNAHDAIECKMEEVPALNGMGSTVVALLISEHSAFVAHAGDSRCYQIRGTHSVFQTHDHSLVAELVRKKVLTEEEARHSPQSNVISRGLGSLKNHVAEIAELPYKKGDRFILCTDGVWGIMPHKELLKRFTSNTDCKVLVHDLSYEIDRIGNQMGGQHDNHTICVVEMEQDSLLKTKWDHIVKYLIGVFVIMILAGLVWILSDKMGDSPILQGIKSFVLSR